MKELRRDRYERELKREILIRRKYGRIIEMLKKFKSS